MSDDVFFWWFASVPQTSCSGPSLVERLESGTCYNRSNALSVFDCLRPSSTTTCAFYHHFSDLQCTKPVNNHTLLCDSCDCEGGTDYDILKCSPAENYTTWHGACGPTCNTTECKFSGVDHVGACIPTPPHQRYPAVMLLGFGECPSFVRNRTYAPSPTGACAGSPVSTQLVQVDVCEGNTMWTCNM